MNEDAAYYQRYLEGQAVGFEQVNAIDDFLANGGSVALLGSSQASDAAHATLNDLAGALGTDLRFTDDEVTDSANNVDGDATIPYTTVFDTSFPLFSKYS